MLLRRAEIAGQKHKKNVMVLFTASWCGACHLLQQFLADPVLEPIFNRNFELLVFDYGERPEDTKHRDTPGADRLIGTLHDTGTSLPLLVFFDGDGRIVVDSVRPVYGPRTVAANVELPDGPNGAAWFLAMLRKVAPLMTRSDLQAIQDGIERYHTTTP